MSSDNKNVYTTLLFVVFIIFLFIIKFGFHELWKDEWQAWLIATDTSWKELVQQFPLEGHPSLWFIILRTVNFVKEWVFPLMQDVYAIQFIHFIFAAATYYFLFNKISLPLWMKAGFGFSYFLFFEYGIVNRSYILIPLILFAIVSAIQKEKINYLLIGVLLFLLCQVEIYGVISAGSIVLYLWIDNEKNNFFSLDRRKIILASAFTTGVIIFYFTVAPDNSSATATFDQSKSLAFNNFLQAIQALTLNTFYPGIFPTAISGYSFLLACLGIVLLVALYMMFKNNKVVVFSYASYLFILWLFSSIIYIGGTRHWGMHLIAFLCFLSLFYFKNKKFEIWQKGLIISFIFFLVIHNIKIINREIREPFSNSAKAGLFIKKNFNNIPVIGINKPYMTPVIGYAEKNFYSLPYGNTYSYFQWKEKQYIPNMNDLIKFKEKIKADRILVIFNKPLPGHIFPALQPLREFNTPSIREEDYYIYLLN